MVVIAWPIVSSFRVTQLIITYDARGKKSFTQLVSVHGLANIQCPYNMVSCPSALRIIDFIMRNYT